ncbi:MAG: hypothetical protein ACRCU3_09120 [Eubacteriaceae bacterium]
MKEDARDLKISEVSAIREGEDVRISFDFLNEYQKVLLYCVGVEDEISENLIRKKPCKEILPQMYAANGCIYSTNARGIKKIAVFPVIDGNCLYDAGNCIEYAIKKIDVSMDVVVKNSFFNRLFSREKKIKITVKANGDIKENSLLLVTEGIKWPISKRITEAENYVRTIFIPLKEKLSIEFFETERENLEKYIELGSKKCLEEEKRI